MRRAMARGVAGGLLATAILASASTRDARADEHPPDALGLGVCRLMIAAGGWRATSCHVDSSPEGLVRGAVTASRELPDALADGEPAACPPLPSALARATACAMREATAWIALPATDGTVGPLASRLARYDVAQGAIEVRQPAALRGLRVDALAHDGASLWLAVSLPGERLVPRGLLRYDWARDEAEAFRGSGRGPCGFLVLDVAVSEDTLWVATDLGLSRLRTTPDAWDEWAHFIPAGGGMEEVSCGALLGEVAAAAAESERDPADARRLLELLAEFRPQWLRRHLRERERLLARRVREGRLDDAEAYAVAAGRRALPLLMEILTRVTLAGAREPGDVDARTAALVTRETAEAAHDEAGLIRAIERASGHVLMFGAGEWPARSASERAQLVERWQAWWVRQSPMARREQ